MTENKGNSNQTSFFGNSQNDPSKQSTTNLFSNQSLFNQKNEDKKESFLQNNTNTNKSAETEPKPLFGNSFFSNPNKDNTSQIGSLGNTKNLFGNPSDKTTEQVNPNIPENKSSQQPLNNNKSSFFQNNNVDLKKETNTSSMFSQTQQSLFTSNNIKSESDKGNQSFGMMKTENKIVDSKNTQNQEKSENITQNIFQGSKEKANALFGSSGFNQNSSSNQFGGQNLFGSNKEESKLAQGGLFNSVNANKQNEVKKEENKQTFGSNFNSTNDNKPNSLLNNSSQQGANMTFGNQSSLFGTSNQPENKTNSTNFFSNQPASNTENNVIGNNQKTQETKQVSSINFGQNDSKQASSIFSASKSNNDNKQQPNISESNTNVKPLFGSTVNNSVENKNLFGPQQPAVNDNKTQPQQTSFNFSGSNSSLFGQNPIVDKQNLNFATNTNASKNEDKKETQSLFSINNPQPSNNDTKQSGNLFPTSTIGSNANTNPFPSVSDPKSSTVSFPSFGGQQDNKIQLNLAPEKKDQTEKKDTNDNKISENKAQTSLFSSNFGGGDKKVEGNQQQASTFSFGGDQTKKEITFGTTENKLTNDNKTIGFGSFNVPKTEENKQISLNEKKEGKTVETVSFSHNQPPQLKDLDKAGIDNLMKKSIEEVINRWKKEMDKQTSKFSDNGERLKHFEQIFNKNFENLMEVSENINQIEAQSKNTLNDLKELNNQEDIIIDQLSLMEKHLDSYLNVFEKKTYPDSNNPRDYIYLAADEISNMVDNIETGINEVKDRLYSVGSDNTRDVQFNLNEKEDLNFDANEFNSLLNNYYNALNGIMFMEHNMKLKISEIENDLKIKKEKEQNYKNTFNY